MLENSKILVLGFVALFLSFVILYSFKHISTQSLLAQVSDFMKKEKNFENEISNLKEKVSLLEKRIGEITSEINKIKNLKVVVGELDIKSQQREKEKVKEKKELKQEKEIKLCENFDAQPKYEVIFNEICWMGDENSPANEWIELKNISQNEIDLTGWQILNKNQKIKIIFEETKILPGQLLVLNRGDDFTGAIKNSDEILFLFDKDCNLQDKVEATSTWPAGDNKTKRTAERKEDLTWQTSENPGGTPGKENSKGWVILEEEKKEAEKTEPKISLNIPSEIFSQKEFEVLLSVSDLKYDTYDVKISILKISEESEQKRTISEISLTGEEWQDSYKYFTKVFTGNSFSGKFKLRINEKFFGEAEVIAKIRQSSNKKIVAETKENIRIKKYQETAQTPIAEITPPPIQPTAQNLLNNEFFEEWEEGKPKYWEWSGAISRINQVSDALVGNFSVELTLTTSEYRGFYQFGKLMDSEKVYFAQIWLKGKGVVRLGIKYPGSNYVYYGEETVINSDDWISLSVSRQPANSGEDGGIKLNVKYDETKGIPSGSKLIIGAAWLSTSPSPPNWPR